MTAQVGAAAAAPTGPFVAVGAVVGAALGPVIMAIAAGANLIWK
jgi:hypothetical protein